MPGAPPFPLTRISHTDRSGAVFGCADQGFGPNVAATQAEAPDAGPEWGAGNVFSKPETIFAQKMAQFTHGSAWLGKA
jgi:hypothetical protein